MIESLMGGSLRVRNGEASAAHPNAGLTTTSRRARLVPPEGLPLIYGLLISLAGILLGLIVALAELPATTSSSYRAPAIAMTVGLLIGPAVFAVLFGIRELLRAGTIVILAVVFHLFVDLILSVYPVTVPTDVVAKAFYAVALFSAGLTIGSAWRPWRLPRSVRTLASRDYSERWLLGAILVCFSLAMLNYALPSHFAISAMLSNLAKPRFAAVWTRGQLGGTDAFRDFLANFGYLLLPFTVLARLRSKRWTSPGPLIGLVLSTVFVLFLIQGGGRRLLLVVVVGAVLTFICASQRILRPKYVVALLVLFGLLVVAQSAILQTRNKGLESFSFDVSQTSLSSDDQAFLHLSEVLQIIPKTRPHVGVQAFVYALARPIPRLFWRSKPVDMGFSLPEFYGIANTTWSISLIGELFLAFGWGAVALGGWVLGRFCSSWSQLLHSSEGRARSAVYAIGTMALMLSVRTMTESVIFLYPLICWIVIDRVLGGGGSATRRPSLPEAADA